MFSFQNKNITNNQKHNTHILYHIPTHFQTKKKISGHIDKHNFMFPEQIDLQLKIQNIAQNTKYIFIFMLYQNTFSNKKIKIIL
jgi:hypothetical protein